MFKRLVWNPDERRLSAVVRILLQLILMLFLLVIPQFFYWDYFRDIRLYFNSDFFVA